MADKAITDPALIERLDRLAASQSQQALPQYIDRRRGAPGAVREAVGSGPDQDRLANIQRYYPDAQPFEDDNFVFTDPDTGRLTLYNPPGLDWGDVASVARDAAVSLGATGGAIVGGTAGLAGGPAAPVTVPGGAVAGAAGGAAAAGSLYDTASRYTTGRVDTRGVGGVFKDAALDAAGAGVGQRVGELAEQGVKRAVGAVRDTALGRAPMKLIQQADEIGMPLTAGTATDSIMLQGMEKSLVTVSPRLQKVYEASHAALKGAVDDVAERMGVAGSAQETGGRIKDAAKASVARFEARQEKLYDEAYELIGDGVVSSLDNVRQLGKDLTGALAAAPASRASYTKPVLDRINALVKDAGEDGLRFPVLRELRTELGKQLKSPNAMGGDPQAIKNARRLYAALTEDMKAAAASGGDEAARALAKADRYTRLGMTTGAPLLNKIIKTEADEKAFAYVMSGTKQGATNLRRLRQAFTPEEWGHVSASTLGMLGKPRSGADFSVDTLFRNYANLSKEAKEALFGGTRYRSVRAGLDRIIDLTAALAKTNALTNTSNTANAIMWQATLAALGGTATAVASGDVGTAAKVGAGAFVAPRVAARLLTTPAFVRWLSLAPVRSSNPNAMTQHVGRLAGLVGRDGLDAEVIGPYLDAIRAAPVPGGQTEATPAQSQ